MFHIKTSEWAAMQDMAADVASMEHRQDELGQKMVAIEPSQEMVAIEQNP